MPLPAPTTGLVSTPVYQQLAGELRRAIESGAMQPGERVPSERELAERYEVSRATANKVLSALVSEGLLEQRRGMGAFVRERDSLPRSLREMKSFTAQAEARGMSPRTEVTRFESRPARTLDRDLRRELALAPEAPVLILERRRFLDDEPVILETRWLPAALMPGVAAEDFAGSFYELLERRVGPPICAENHSVAAVVLDPDAAAALEVPPGHAALEVRSTGFRGGEDESPVPIWHHHLFMRGDRYSLQSNCQSSRFGIATELQFLQS